jgi:hypothetical protein
MILTNLGTLGTPKTLHIREEPICLLKQLTLAAEPHSTMVRNLYSLRGLSMQLQVVAALFSSCAYSFAAAM